MPAPEQSLCHEALLYRSDHALAGAVATFARAGQTAGEAVLVALPRRNLEPAQRALDELGRRGPGDGEVTFEDMAEVASNPSCLLSVYEAWIASHDGPVRVVGEAVWPERSYAERVELLRHEALLNHALARAQVAILCPYDAERLDAVTLTGAELTHPQLVDEDGGSRVSPVYGDPLEIGKGLHWPQADAVEPVHAHEFKGDLHGLRHAVAADPIAAILTPRRRQDLVFAVNEAASNAIKHSDGTCRTRLWNDGAGIVAEVSTASVLEDAFAGRRRPPAEAPRGWGLWLINQVCDVVELRSSDAGTTLRMHVRDPDARGQANLDR